MELIKTHSSYLKKLYLMVNIFMLRNMRESYVIFTQEHTHKLKNVKEIAIVRGLQLYTKQL